MWDCSTGAFRLPAFYWRRGWTAASTVMCRKQRPRSTVWLPRAPGCGGVVVREIMLLQLRTLLARAHGDEAASRDYRDRYRAMAKALGFEGQIAMAEAMT